MEKPTRGGFSWKKGEKTKILIAVLWTTAICITAFIASSYFYKQKSEEQIKAELESQRKAFEDELAKRTEFVGKDDKEVSFNKPIEVDWEGRIIANLMGGIDYGLKRVPEDKDFPFFYAYTGNDSNAGLEGKVRVKGKWTGITCAYQNTVFGRCVPDVKVEEIGEIK